MEILETLRSVAARFAVIDVSSGILITDIVDGLRERYRFFQIPDRVSELDPTQGIKFEMGRFRDIAIDRLEIFDSGIVAHGKSDSNVLDEFLDDFEGFATEMFSMKFPPSSPVSKIYLTAFEVKMDHELSSLVRPLAKLEKAFTGFVQDQGFTLPAYGLGGFTIQTDGGETEPKPLVPGKFVFERRVGKAFSENLYFSDAPLATDRHKDLLEMLEELFD